MNSKWNLTLREAIAPTFSAAVVTQFREQLGLRHDWPQYVPKASSDSFLGTLRQSITRTLSQMTCLLCADNEFRIPSRAIILTSAHRDAEGDPLIPNQFITGKFYLHGQYKPVRDGPLFKDLGASQMSNARMQRSDMLV